MAKQYKVGIYCRLSVDAVSYTHLDVYKRQDKDDYEQEAMRRGATLCMDKMKGLLLQDKLVEYAYRQLSGEKALTFHKLLFVYAEAVSYTHLDVYKRQGRKP